MPIFPKKSIKGKGLPKIDFKKKTISYMSPLTFERGTVSFSPKQMMKDIKTVAKKRGNLKKAAKSEAKAFFNRKKMTPTPATLRMKEQDFYRKLKNR